MGAKEGTGGGAENIIHSRKIKADRGHASICRERVGTHETINGMPVTKEIAYMKVCCSNGDLTFLAETRHYIDI